MEAYKSHMSFRYGKGPSTSSSWRSSSRSAASPEPVIPEVSIPVSISPPASPEHEAEDTISAAVRVVSPASTETVAEEKIEKAEVLAEQAAMTEAKMPAEEKVIAAGKMMAEERVVIVKPMRPLPSIVMPERPMRPESPGMPVHPMHPISTLPEKECGFCITPAMAYVPMQKWEHIYESEQAMERGTLFPQLDLPFLGKGDCVR